MTNSSDPTTDYANKVLAGEIVAGRFVWASCKRHLEDLKKGPKRGLRFDPEEAARAFRFFPAMFTVTAGAKAGEPFHLLDWMTFVVGSLFGWRNADGTRRFRQAWIETGKGQAKSPLMGAIGIYMTGFWRMTDVQPTEIPIEKPAWADNARAEKEEKNWPDEQALQGIKRKNDILWLKAYGWVVVSLMLLFVVLFAASLCAWVWHYVTPYPFLTPEQLSKIQSVIFSGSLGAIVSSYMQRQLNK